MGREERGTDTVRPMEMHEEDEDADGDVLAAIKPTEEEIAEQVKERESSI